MKILEQKIIRLLKEVLKDNSQKNNIIRLIINRIEEEPYALDHVSNGNYFLTTMITCNLKKEKKEAYIRYMKTKSLKMSSQNKNNLTLFKSFIKKENLILSQETAIYLLNMRRPLFYMSIIANFLHMIPNKVISVQEIQVLERKWQLYLILNNYFK